MRTYIISIYDKVNNTTISINPGQEIEINLIDSKKKYILNEVYIHSDSPINTLLYLVIDNFTEDFTSYVWTDKRAFGLYIPFNKLKLRIKSLNPLDTIEIHGFIVISDYIEKEEKKNEKKEK